MIGVIFLLENFKIDKIGNFKNIHFVGIGGISMSGIAEILHHCNFVVTGSDANKSEIIENLISHGIPVSIGSNLSFVRNADIVVYTAAIQQTDPELLEAHRLNIPTMERSEFLGYITKTFSNTICVSGTHGKTTTTSMISLCFLEALQDPSIQVGAFLNVLDGNYKVGNSEHFIIEACEYVESFLKFSPKAEIILNIDNDHLDYFKTFENIKNAFVKYTKLLPDDGLLIINGDDINCLDLPQYTNANVLTYGINNKNSHFYGKNILFDNDGLPEFEVYKNNKFFTKIKLSVPGKHNVLNALSCIALCDYYGIDKKNIQNALKKFTGAHRRFEFKGKLNGASIYDDYGHHPTEIIATSTSVNEKKHNKSWVVFQPHTYSRTKNLLDDFANALLNFDNIIVLDIYAAREANTYNISSKDLVDKIVSLGKNAKYIPDFNECVSLLKDNVKENDIVLTLGAGTVTQIGPMLLNN